MGAITRLSSLLPITLVNLKQLRFMIDELKLGSITFENKERETSLFCYSSTVLRSRSFTMPVQPPSILSRMMELFSFALQSLYLAPSSRRE